MTARTGSTPKPSTQTPPEPPVLTDGVSRAIADLPRKMAHARRHRAGGEVWLQSDEAGDGWIRARVVEAGSGFLGILTHASPAIGRGTWARLPAGVDGTDAEQIRVYPLAAHGLGPTTNGSAQNASGPMYVECEIPVDATLTARFLR